MKNTLLLLLIIGFGCKDESVNSDFPLPRPLLFSLSDSNLLFKLYPKDSMNFGNVKNVILYDSLGFEKKMSYIILSTNKNVKYYFSIGDIVQMSAISKIKNYYIHWPNGEKDTLIC